MIRNKIYYQLIDWLYLKIVKKVEKEDMLYQKSSK